MHKDNKGETTNIIKKFEIFLTASKMTVSYEAAMELYSPLIF